MTFEYAPDWMESLLGAMPYSPTTGLGSAAQFAAGQVPAHPDARQMARLVEELFAEGTLSVEQFQSLSAAPELEPYLDTPPHRAPGTP